MKFLPILYFITLVSTKEDDKTDWKKEVEKYGKIMADAVPKIMIIINPKQPWQKRYQVDLWFLYKMFD